MTEPHPLYSTRVFVWDLLRSAWFLVILFFHGSWFFWPEFAGPPDPFPTLFWELSTGYLRLGGFAGFAILMLSSFLLARSPRFPSPYFFPFLLGGWLLFQVFINLRDRTHITMIWDIYPLLAVGLGSAVLVRRYATRVLGVLGVLGFLLPLTTPWRWHFWTTPGSSNWQQALVGLCPLDYADWPLLPWVGLVWSSFWLGHLSKTGVFQCWHRQEWLLWGGLLMGLWPWAGSYSLAPSGNGWACYIYRQMPATFYWHWAANALMIRVGLLRAGYPGLRPLEIVERSQILQWVGTLQINRQFFLAYVIHFPVLWGIGQILALGKVSARGYDLGIILGIMATEGLTRIASRLLRQSPGSRDAETYYSTPSRGAHHREETP